MIQNKNGWLFVGCVVIALSPALCIADDAVRTITIEPTVTQVVDTVAGALSVRSLRRAIYQNKMTSSGITTSESSTYKFMGKNVWAISTISEFENGSVQARTLSLCGLIELVSVGTGIAKVHTISIEPFRGGINTMGIQVDMNFSTSKRTVNLTIPAGSRNLCTPRPGSVFSYLIRADSQIAHGPDDRPKIVSTSFETNCSVGSLSSTGMLQGIWSGEHIPVTCESKNLTTGTQNAANFVYLVDAGLYLYLGIVRGSFQSQITYSSLESSAD